MGKELAASMEQWYSYPVEARTRVSRFAGSGVYKRFMSRKGGDLPVPYLPERFL